MHIHTVHTNIYIYHIYIHNTHIHLVYIFVYTHNCKYSYIYIYIHYIHLNKWLSDQSSSPPSPNLSLSRSGTLRQPRNSIRSSLGSSVVGSNVEIHSKSVVNSRKSPFFHGKSMENHHFLMGKPWKTTIC